MNEIKVLIQWVIGLSLILAIVKCNDSDWYKAQKHRDEVREAQEATPRIIRNTIDGCTVYTFKDSGNWHYFIRCANTTTTEKNWTENCGKNCTRNRQETIITQNKDTK